MKTILAILILIAFALSKEAGPVKPPAPPAVQGPGFSVETHNDSGVVNGRKVIVPITFITWKNAKGDSVTWDADNGSVVKGDSSLRVKDSRNMIVFLLNKIGEANTIARLRDSVASEYLKQSFNTLNPQAR